jgi:D-apiose dehydrogenase
MDRLRGGLVGCGFFSRNHLHAWREVEGADIVAVCDLDEEKARTRAREFGIERTYTDAEKMLRDGSVDFVDVATQAHTHLPLVRLAARYGAPVICQKPLAPSMEKARAIVDACKDAGTALMIHENFRWQTPMRNLKDAATQIGDLFFGRISFRSAYDVYADQPYLAEDERFILYDLGVHLLDLARFFFGDADRLYCQTARVNPRVNGEDVATVMLKTTSGTTCLVEASYASELEVELFPQTLVHLEGPGGSVTLDAGYSLTTVKDKQVDHRIVAPRKFSWSTPPTEAIQDSMVAIQQHWVECLTSRREPETSGADNLRTLDLMFGAYESAETGLPYRQGSGSRGN